MYPDSEKDRLMKLAEVYQGNTQLNPIQAPAAPQVEKGMAGQMGDMAKQKFMQGTVDTGSKFVTDSVMGNPVSPMGSAVGSGGMDIAAKGIASQAGAGAAGAGMTAAMPYVGAGLMAGKMLGLFNEGGQVGPLSPQYNYAGSDALRSYIGRNPEVVRSALENEYRNLNRVGAENLDRQNREWDEKWGDITPFEPINQVFFGSPFPSEENRLMAFRRNFFDEYGDLINQAYPPETEQPKYKAGGSGPLSPEYSDFISQEALDAQQALANQQMAEDSLLDKLFSGRLDSPTGSRSVTSIPTGASSAGTYGIERPSWAK